MNLRASRPAARPAPEASRTRGFALAILVLALLLGTLLHGDLQPENVLFSNDGPLGRLVSQCHAMPARITGCWEDLNSIGSRGGPMLLNISGALHLLLSPVWFSKLYAPAALLLLGIAAWFCFRQFGLSLLASLLGAVAAMLNSGFFSAACWGMAAHPITVASTFLALGALSQESGRGYWARTMLAGLAVGLGVTEGADIGAMFSVLVAVFIVYKSLAPGIARWKNLAAGAGRLAVVVLCAGFFATQAISELVTTSIAGIAGTDQDAKTKEERWDWATQWSLPKAEALGLVVPGLFGYSMLVPGGDGYWGAIGQDPAWGRYFDSGSQGPPPKGYLRYVGGGSYMGVAVALIALWAALQSLRRRNSVFSLEQRKWLWFWSGVGVISLLLAFGRFAPFYQFLYALPYASTVRNPVKFLHVMSLALVTLFAYGIDAIGRRHLSPAAARGSEGQPDLKDWWARAGKFEKNWTRGCLVALGLSLLAWVIYGTDREDLVRHLQYVKFDEDQARAIAAFSIRQAGWFLLLFGAAVGLVTLILGGAFAGKRAKWGTVLLGLMVAADLGRANQPWIRYWDYKDKYASNPIVDFLRDKPYEHRVALVPLAINLPLPPFTQLYKNEWMQQLFPYYDVQSLDIVQMSRKPKDLQAYEEAFDPKTHGVAAFGRYYQLTNTRYMLGPASVMDAMNDQLDPDGHRFRIAERFNVVCRPGIENPTTLEQLTVELDPEGPFALYEYTGALPRARLYDRWQSQTNDAAALQQLSDLRFDPAQSVIVDQPLAPGPAHAGQSAGTVEFESYAPKDIVFNAHADAASVLLLNDRYDPEWRVLVDGRPEPLLRCNYIMRGVCLAPGSHRVEFQFRPPQWPLYVSLAAGGFTLLLLGFVAAGDKRRREPQTATEKPARAPGLAPAHLK